MFENFLKNICKNIYLEGCVWKQIYKNCLLNNIWEEIKKIDFMMKNIEILFHPILIRLASAHVYITNNIVPSFNRKAHKSCRLPDILPSTWQFTSQFRNVWSSKSACLLRQNPPSKGWYMHNSTKRVCFPCSQIIEALHTILLHTVYRMTPYRIQYSLAHYTVYG